MVGQLHESDLPEAADHVVLIGCPGARKTHIATALALQAIERGS
jgi:DNA replication protein DnaC